MALDVSTRSSAPLISRVRASLEPREWAGVWGMTVTILALHIVGWGTLLFFVAPRHFSLGATTFGAATGLVAYTLGMRHAFDADHIAAIDNTTRKLMADGQRPLSVGFWFSLGHSSVVFAMCLLLSLGVRAVAGQLGNDNSALQQTTGVVGTLVSGCFLLLIGVINLVILFGILRVFRDMRRGFYDEAALEQQLNNRGLMNRILGRATRAITKSWHMYPLGVLFGLGFDTATEVGLLLLASAAAFTLPWYAILCLPVIFAAGMSLLDTIDGSFMNFAYGWAFSQPVRKVYYNITITGLSVMVALVIGLVELLGLLAQKLGIDSGPLGWIAGLDLNVVGYVIVGLFALTWIVALAIWKAARIEQRWLAGMAPEPSAGDGLART